MTRVNKNCLTTKASWNRPILWKLWKQHSTGVLKCETYYFPPERLHWILTLDLIYHFPGWWKVGEKPDSNLIWWREDEEFDPRNVSSSIDVSTLSPFSMTMRSVTMHCLVLSTSLVYSSNLIFAQLLSVKMFHKMNQISCCWSRYIDRNKVAGAVRN